jgi:hypothetical protein
VQDMKRRTLSKNELHYIHHGDTAVEQQKARQLSEGHIATPQSVVDDTIMSPGSETLSPHYPGQEVSENALNSLQQELLGAEHDEDEEDYEDEEDEEDEEDYEDYEDEIVAAELPVSEDEALEQSSPVDARAANREMGREDSLIQWRMIRLGPIDTGVYMDEERGCSAVRNGTEGMEGNPDALPEETM